MMPDIGASAEATVLDAHGHFYPRLYRVSAWLAAAAANLDTAARQLSSTGSIDRVLLVADRRGQDTARLLETACVPRRLSWSLEQMDEGRILRISRTGSPPLYIIVGQQVVSGEGLEILSFGGQEIPDGNDFLDTVEVSLLGSAVTILPWGFGKWFGKRANLIRKVIDEYSDESLFVGDSGNRPEGTRIPSLIARALDAGIANLAGSDPLPLPGHQKRIGGKGVKFTGRPLANRAVTEDLWNRLRAMPTGSSTFGGGASWKEFLVAQIKMKILKSDPAH